MANNTILEKALRGKLPEAARDVTLDDMRGMLEVLLTRVMEAEVSTRVERELEAGGLGKEQGVVVVVLRRCRGEQGAVKCDARVEIARREVEVHFHASTFIARTVPSAVSRRSRASAARE